MDQSTLTDSARYLCEPNAEWFSSRDRYFVYSGSLATLRRLPDAAQPYLSTYSADGVEFRVPLEHGRVLEFRDVLLRRYRWVVFELDGSIWLDTGAQLLRLSPDGSASRCQRHGLLCLIEIAVANVRLRIRTVINPIRALLRDPVVGVEDCHPAFDILEELSSAEGMRLWTHRWSKGLGAVRALDFPAANL